MNNKLYNDRKSFYKKQLKRYRTNKSRIKFLEEMLFLVEMVDRWNDFDKASYEALKDLIQEVKSWES